MCWSMAFHPLSRLTNAGILGRTGPTLRVTPRFLDHMEATAARVGPLGLDYGPLPVIERAVASWDEYAGDAREAARFLVEFLGERNQWGRVKPMFPVLEEYAVA
jgi:hypothetical protein